MIHDKTHVGVLFSRVCDRIRKSATQSDEAVVRQARSQIQGEGHQSGEAVCVVAAAALLRQRPESSLALLQHRVDLLQSDPTANEVAGHAWLAAGDESQAKQCFDQAVRLDPLRTDSWYLLGLISESNDKPDEAIEFFQRGRVMDDDRHRSALRLSGLYEKKGELANAIDTLRVSLLRDHRSVVLNRSLARMLQKRASVMKRKRRPLEQRRMIEEALRCLRVVNAASPSSQTWVSQGSLEMRLQMFQDAHQSFQSAVDRDPTCAQALTHLAGAHVDQGDLKAAAERFERAIEIDPSQASTHFRYTRSKRFGQGPETEAYLELLLQLSDDDELKDQQRVHFHFAIAKIYEDTHRYDQAWSHYDRANHLKPGHSQSQAKRRRILRDQGSPLKCIVDQSTEFFTREMITAFHASANRSDKPVFIVGMPRSGTTLTEQILTSHSQIAGAGELNDIDQIRCQIQRICDRHHRLESTQPTGESQPAYPRLVGNVPAAELRRCADDYLNRLNEFGARESRVTDKMPTNFMQLGLIAMMFPHATIIHCRRNPMDVMVSSYCQNLSAPFCDLEQLKAYHREYRRMMSHWEQILPMTIHTVDYEHLVADPEAHARGLIEHCGLRWEEACLRFHTNTRTVHTPSKWQVRQPMYNTSVEKWRRYEPQLRSLAQEIDAEMASEKTSEKALR